MSATQSHPCEQCGAALQFAPGQAALVCSYCGFKNTLVAQAADLSELDFLTYARNAHDAQDLAATKTLHCDGCGADSTVAGEVTAAVCPFCGSPKLTANEARVIMPKALLPFKIDDRASRALFQRWIAGLWFAPNALKRLALVQGRLAGLYIPYWTYDCHADTSYEGERGDDYTVTETYTETVNGRSETRTREVVKTRWSRASGRVADDFDDVLVMASESLPRDYAESLEPWDLDGLVAFDAAYLSGFRAECYKIGLAAGFDHAKQRMQPRISSTICADIGGDHQRIHRADSTYERITFKHVLLPIWLAAYRYDGRVFRFLVNGRTGEVQGERPYSPYKIAFAVLLALVALAAAAYVYQQGHS